MSQSNIDMTHYSQLIDKNAEGRSGLLNLMRTKLGNLFICLEPRTPEQIYELCDQLPLDEAEHEKFNDERQLLPYELDAIIGIKFIDRFIDMNDFYLNTNVENFYEAYELILAATMIEKHYTLAMRDKAVSDVESTLFQLAKDGYSHKIGSKTGLDKRWGKNRLLYSKAINIAKAKWEKGCDFKHNKMKDWLLNDHEENGSMPFTGLSEKTLLDNLKSLLRDIGRTDLIYNGFK